MTFPSMAIALPFYYTHFSSIESVAFRCLCMQSEKLNKESASITWNENDYCNSVIEVALVGTTLLV
jgi:hypothetical protein